MARVSTGGADGVAGLPIRAAALAHALGPGFLLALVLCVARKADTAFGLMGTPALAWVAGGFLAGAVVVAVACALPGRARRAAGEGSHGRTGVACAAIACALCLAGAFGSLGAAALAEGAVAASDPLPPVASAAGLACGLGLGAGSALFALLWAGLLAALGSVALIRCAAGAVLTAGVCYVGFSLAVSLPAAAVVLAGCALGCAACCLPALRGIREGAAPADPAACRRLLFAMSDGASRIAALPPGAVRARDIYRMLWIPLVGIAFSAFIVGLTWDPVVAYEGEWRSLAVDVWGTLVGSLLAAATVLLAARRGDGPHAIRILSRAVQQVALALVLVTPALQQAFASDALFIACDVASTAGFALITLIGLTELVLAARLTGVPTGPALAGVVAVVAASVEAGLLAIDVWGTGGRTVCLVLEAAFLTAAGVSFALRARGDDGVAPASGGSGGRGDRLARIAAECGLSPREAEVLAYVARGYGSSFIAPELGISENTVRTHVRHIYEKLGVSSREELITRVNG